MQNLHKEITDRIVARPKRKDYPLRPNSFAWRLRAAIDERDLSDSEACIKADLKPGFARDCYRKPNLSPSIAHVGQMARALNVDQEWLAWGVERMSPLTRAPLRGYVGAGDEVEWFDEPLAAEAAQGRMLISPGVRLEALEVRGDSQWPRFLSGETILFDARPRPPQELAGHFAVVQTDKGSRMVKILRGSNKGANKWRLESLNAPPLDDVDVLWAHNVIVAVVGAREAASAWPTGLGSRRPKSRRELTGGQLRLLREGMVATLAAAGTQRSDAEILVTDLFARIGEGPPPPLPPPSSGPPPPIAKPRPGPSR